MLRSQDLPRCPKYRGLNGFMCPPPSTLRCSSERKPGPRTSRAIWHPDCANKHQVTWVRLCPLWVSVSLFQTWEQAMQVPSEHLPSVRPFFWACHLY